MSHHQLAPPLPKVREHPRSAQSYRTTLSTLPSKVDFVISFKVGTSVNNAEEQLQNLLVRIADVGLLQQVRPGSEPGSVLVFIKCTQERLRKEVYDSRSRDWLSGIRVSIPKLSDSDEALAITDGERLRLVYLILTASIHENGAGITPQLGEWSNVVSIFPLHNKEFDTAWLRRWSTKWTVDDVELEHLCEHFGTKVAMYFAFLQFYLLSLSFPTILGLLAFFFLPEYSIMYSILMSIWATLFIGLWERRQRDLAVRWNVRKCSKLERRRAAFVESTGNESAKQSKIPTSPSLSRLFRETLVLPFVLVAAMILAIVLTTIFAIEVFIGEVYAGPLKSLLTFTPTVLFTVLVGPFSSFYMKAAHKLTLYENYETDGSYNAAITRKSFVLNFMTAYTALFLTLFVYLPFGHIIVPRLDIFGLTTAYSAYGVSAKPFVIDHHRLRNQLFYFAVTAQIVNLFIESVLPVLLRLVKGEAQELQAKLTGNDNHHPVDRPEEAVFLKTVRMEEKLPEYDTYGDYAELVIQFGYNVMFSPIWPLTPVCAFINNIVELRADAAKLCQNMKRPVPMRADSIGPWADNLVFLTWLGSLTTASITYLLRGDSPTKKPILNMLAVCLFAEHAYLLMRKMITIVLSRIPNDAENEMQQQEEQIRRSYILQFNGSDSSEFHSTEEEDIDSFFKDSLHEICSNAKQFLQMPETKVQRQSTKKEL